jgi:zinc transport system ATP-binding protein
VENEIAVNIKDVNFSYGKTPTLENVSLEVGRGEALYVVGPNGGGKTTLLKLILGIEIPDSGSIQVFGDRPGKNIQRVGYVPQYAKYDQQFPVTTLDVVLMGRLGRSARGHYSAVDKKAAENALEEMELSQAANLPFSELSGGQRQRTMIARAICDNPDLLLLDEPTANVDARTSSRFIKLLESLNQRMAILMISHDLGMVANMFKRVVMVNRSIKAVKTCDLAGDTISETYGDDFRIIHHHG